VGSRCPENSGSDCLDIAGRKNYIAGMKAIVSQKGQVTIPKGCRERLGLLPGTVVDFEAVEGQLVGRKLQPEDVFRKWRGKGRLPGNMSVKQYMKRVRG